MKRRRNFFHSIIASLISLIFLLIILELLFRVVVYISKGPEKFRAEVMPDGHFGWVNNTLMKEANARNKCGEEVKKVPLQHKFIKKFPKYAGNKNILFIGDSYTQAWGVSTGKAFFDIFEENMKEKYSVYVAGIGGYGNLQEYMLIDSLYSEIKPKVVVWQLCSNDLTNNVFKLENSSIFNNQRPRPYLDIESRQIKFKNPGFFLFDWSKGFRFLFQKLLIIDHKYNTGIISFFDSFLELEEKEKDLYEDKGLLVLDTLVGMAVKKFPDIRFVGFATDSIYDNDFKKIFHLNGATYFDEFYSCVDSIEGTNCLPLDAHWNHLGHQIVGNTLCDLIGKMED